MRSATCKNVVTVTVVVGGRALDSHLRPTQTRQQRVICGLPSAPDRNGLCVECENAIHEMSELHAEALKMDTVRNWAPVLSVLTDERCERVLAELEAEDAASNRGAW
jgi:hypothetical protein